MNETLGWAALIGVNMLIWTICVRLGYLLGRVDGRGEAERIHEQERRTWMGRYARLRDSVDPDQGDAL